MTSNHHTDVTIEEWEARKLFMDFSDEDAQLLKSIKAEANLFVEEIIDDLYVFFHSNQETQRFLHDPALVIRLKDSQKQYFLGLFSGDYGEQHLISRLKVGRIHHQIGLPPEWYIGAYAKYVELTRPCIYAINPDDIPLSDKIFSALVKLKDLDLTLAMTTYIAAREELIEEQTHEIIELSTPVVEIWDGIVMAPIIGTLDSQRAQRCMERLLETIVAKQSQFALLDITGVAAVDTATAQYLIDAMNAVRLLGSTVIVTGVSPAIAQTLVHLGIDLSGMSTCPSLNMGLKLALEKLNHGTLNE